MGSDSWLMWLDLSLVVQFNMAVKEFDDTTRQRANSSNSMPEQVQKWSPPVTGKLKINVDAAFKEGRAALAMVMRDPKGSLIFLRSSISSASSAYHAEMLALDWACKHAEGLPWDGLEWRSDAQAVVNEIVSSNDPGGWHSRFSVCRIRDRFDRFDWNLGWTQRESNNVADLSAKMTLDSGYCFLF